MSYSYHLRLRRGTLKIKSENQLRGRERDREVPVWRVGQTYLIWIRRERRQIPAVDIVGKGNNSMGGG